MKRHISLLLLLSLLLAMAAGCATGDPIDTTAAPTTSPTTIATEPPATEATDPVEVYQNLLDQFPADITMDIALDYEMEVAGFPFHSSTTQYIRWSNH